MSYVKRNWSQYNQSLINRGSLTIWIEESFSKKWLIQPKIGRPKFSSHVIQIALVLREVYKLTLRALQGFISSLLVLSKQSLRSPHYSLFSKRCKEVAATLPKLSGRLPRHLVIDSSGLKVYGEGEWKVKVHGASKRRRWVKLHIAVDPVSQEIVAAMPTMDGVADSTVLPHLVNAAPKSVRGVSADGAYDRKSCRTFLFKKGIKELIPPQKNARLRKEKVLARRNEAISMILGLGGDAAALSLWKRLTGFSKRSLVETAFSRLKRTFGDKLKSHSFKNQQVESLIRCYVLNEMTRLQAVIKII